MFAKVMLLNSSAEQLAELQQLFNVKSISYRKGTCIFGEGQAFTHGFILQQGLMRSYYLHNDTEVNLRLFVGGQHSAVLPAAGLIHNAFGYSQHLVSDESVECIEDCSGWQFEVLPFVQADKLPVVGQLWERLLAEHYLTMERRLRMIQHKRAVDKYAYFCQVMPALLVERMPAYHIASYLGLTPEALSRVKHNLKP